MIKSRKKKPAKKQAKPKRNRKEKKASSLSLAWNKSRYVVLAGVVIFLFLLLGSWYMRLQIVSLVRKRSVQSSAVVVSHPFEISPGLDVAKTRLIPRLKRLRYQQVSSTVENEGQYSLIGNNLTIYLRGTTASASIRQKPQKLQLSLRGSLIEKISDVRKQQMQSIAWLEPETLAQLGRTATRATSARRLSEFSPTLIKALLAVEDERFRYHFGIDPIGIFRAIFTNLRSGHLRQGGSTITQQLAKNLLHGNERSLARKIKEAISAVLIETAFTKDQILELYLNEVFLAQEGQVAIHGFGEAALSFFGKEASELTIAESATLAGLVKAPSTYSPRFHPEQAKERRQIVLDKLLESGGISKEEFEKASSESLDVKPSRRTKRIAPYFIDYLSRLLNPAAEQRNVDLRPLTIHTGIDVEYQNCAVKAVQNGLIELESKFPRVKRNQNKLQAALVSIRPKSGEVIAWVGGRDYAHNQFDRVSLAKRQPGSAFKPFVYLTALDKNLNNYRVARTTSLLADEPLSIDIAGAKTWEPQNYDRKFRGDVTVRQALALSLNVPAIQIARKVGIDRVANTAALFGFGNQLPQVPSLALGAGEVTPLDLAHAYSVLANSGVKVNLRPIVSVTRAQENEVVYESDLDERRIASESAVFVLTDMMRSVIENGTAQSVRQLGFTGPVAGKTGTTNDARDAWFAAYTPSLLATVWVGYDDNSELGLTGGQAAVPIWTNYMLCTKNFEKNGDFKAPDGVLFRQVDLETGLLATSECPADQVVNEVFVAGSEPVVSCPEHSPGQGLFDTSQSSEARDTKSEEDSKESTPVSDFLNKLFN